MLSAPVTPAATSPGVDSEVPRANVLAGVLRVVVLVDTQPLGHGLLLLAVLLAKQATQAVLLHRVGEGLVLHVDGGVQNLDVVRLGRLGNRGGIRVGIARDVVGIVNPHGSWACGVGVCGGGEALRHLGLGGLGPLGGNGGRGERISSVGQGVGQVEQDGTAGNTRDVRAPRGRGNLGRELARGLRLLGRALLLGSLLHGSLLGGLLRRDMVVLGSRNLSGVGRCGLGGGILGLGSLRGALGAGMRHVGALSPLGVVHLGGRGALGALRRGGLLGILVGHRRDAGVVRLHRGTLVGALTVLEVGKTLGQAQALGHAEHTVLHGVAKLGYRGGGVAERTRDARGNLARGRLGGLHALAHRQGLQGVRGLAVTVVLGDRLEGGDCVGIGIAVRRDSLRRVAVVIPIVRRRNLARRRGCGLIHSIGGVGVVLNGHGRGSLGGKLRGLVPAGHGLGHGNHPHLGLDVGDLTRGRKDLEIAQDALSVAHTHDLLHLATHGRLLGRLDCGNGRDDGVVDLLRLVVGRLGGGARLGRGTIGAHVVEHAQHGRHGGLVIHGAARVRGKAAGDERHAPGKQRKRGDDANDPEGAAEGGRQEEQNLDERADGVDDDAVRSRGGNHLLDGGNLGTGEEVDTGRVIVGQDDDGTIPGSVLALGLVEGHHVLAVRAGTKLPQHVLATIRHGKQGNGSGAEHQPQHEGRGAAQADEHHSHKQHGHHDTGRQSPQRRHRELLHLRVEPMGRENARQGLGAVELFLAAGRSDADLGVEVIEVVFRCAHPFTFRIAARPLPAFVSEEYTSTCQLPRTARQSRTDGHICTTSPIWHFGIRVRCGGLSPWCGSEGTC